MAVEFENQKARIDKYIQKIFSEGELKRLDLYGMRAKEICILGREASCDPIKSIMLAYDYGMAKGARYERTKQKKSGG